VRALEHAPREIRAVPGHDVVEGTVRCARQDDRDATMPFVRVLELAEDRIAASRVPIDSAPIFAPRAPQIAPDRMP
jgi:hypothetical protein